MQGFICADGEVLFWWLLLGKNWALLGRSGDSTVLSGTLDTYISYEYIGY